VPYWHTLQKYGCLPSRFSSLGSLIAFDTGEAIYDLMDCIYYSFITYTTLGFGDLIPTGSLRFLTGGILNWTGFDHMDGIIYVFRNAEILG